MTLMIVALGFAIFRWVAARFPIFEAHNTIPTNHRSETSMACTENEEDHIPVG